MIHCFALQVRTFLHTFSGFSIRAKSLIIFQLYPSTSVTQHYTELWVILSVMGQIKKYDWNMIYVYFLTTNFRLIYTFIRCHVLVFMVVFGVVIFFPFRITSRLPSASLGNTFWDFLENQHEKHFIRKSFLPLSFHSCISLPFFFSPHLRKEEKT